MTFSEDKKICKFSSIDNINFRFMNLFGLLFSTYNKEHFTFCNLQRKAKETFFSALLIDRDFRGFFQSSFTRNFKCVNLQCGLSVNFESSQCLIATTTVFVSKLNT